MNSLQCQLNEDEFDFQNYLDRGGLMDNIVQDLRALYNTTAEFRNWSLPLCRIPIFQYFAYSLAVLGYFFFLADTLQNLEVVFWATVIWIFRLA